MALDIYAYPYEGHQTSEAEYSRLIDAALGGSGMIETPAFAVAGMTLTVSNLDGVIRGHRFLAASGTLGLESTASARTALVGLRLDYTETPFVSAFVTYALGATAPTPVQTPEGIFELPLCTIPIPANANAIGAATITPRWNRLRSPSASYVYVQEDRPSNPPVGSIRIW